MKKRLGAVEIWFLRRMLRVPWTARTTNTEVSQISRAKRKLMTTIRERQLGFLRHTLRGAGTETVS